MKNILKLFFGLLILPLVSGAAFAAKINISHLKSSWGNPELGRCEGNTNVRNAVIGNNKNCKGNNRDDWCRLGDDYGVLMLIAREVNENGAYFCPTTVYGEKHGRGNSWTLYGDSSQGQGCFWACKKGFSGEKCQSTTVLACDTEPVTRSTYDSYAMVREPEIEDYIPMFELNQYENCTYKRDKFGEEHDQFLAVVDWLPSGHGVVVQPMSVRANMWKRGNWEAAIIAYVAGTSQVLCKNGYTVNSVGTDCVPLDEEKCAANEMCADWATVNFDEENMVKELSLTCVNTRGTTAGVQYRCKAPGYAFASVMDHTCTPCVESMRTGINPSNGTCVTCEIGEIFDATAPGYCAEATGFSQEQMQYGTGQNKNVELELQCWTIVAPDEYSNCVRGIEENLPSGVSRAVTAVSVTGGASRFIPAAI